MNRRSIAAALFTLALAPIAASAAVSTDSRTYKDVDTEIVFEAAREAITSNGWRLKDESKDDGMLVARTRISALSWGATVSVNITEAKKGVKVTASAGTEMSTRQKTERDIERFFDKLERKLDSKRDRDEE